LSVCYGWIAAMWGKIHSIGRFIIAMIVIFLSSIFLILDKLPRTDNEIVSIAQFFSVFITSFYLAHLIGMGKAKVLLTDEGLVKDFPKLSNEYKNGLASDNQTQSIKKGESIHASKSFRWVFYFMSAGFSVLVLTKVFNPNSETTWIALGVLGNGLLFYGLMIKGQKKNN